MGAKLQEIFNSLINVKNYLYKFLKLLPRFSLFYHFFNVY